MPITFNPLSSTAHCSECREIQPGPCMRPRCVELREEAAAAWGALVLLGDDEQLEEEEEDGPVELEVNRIQPMNAISPSYSTGRLIQAMDMYVPRTGTRFWDIPDGYVHFNVSMNPLEIILSARSTEDPHDFKDDIRLGFYQGPSIDIDWRFVAWHFAVTKRTPWMLYLQADQSVNVYTA